METNTITTEDVKTIYDSLKTADSKSTEILEAAKEETEAMSQNDQLLEEISFNVTEADYRDSVTPYDLSDEDTEKFLTVIQKYAADKTINKKTLYDGLPSKFQSMISGLCASNGVGIPEATKIVLESFLNDAKNSAAVNEYNTSMSDLIKSSNDEYAKIYSESIDDVFSKIDEIREQNPEKAANIEAIKNAFDKAKSFDSYTEFLKTANFKKLSKKADRFENEIFYFQSKLKKYDIDMGNIDRIPMTISRFYPHIPTKVIISFIIGIFEQAYSMDISKLETVTYAYKLLDNIYSLEFKYMNLPENFCYTFDKDGIIENEDIKFMNDLDELLQLFAHKIK